MSCSCTGNCDLININPLALSDTFHTWYDRTNEVITSLNKVNIYDVQVGLTNSGLTGVSTCQNGNYSGLLTIKAQVGPGIGLGSVSTPNYYLNSIMLDVTGLSGWEAGSGYDDAIGTRPTSSFPALNDWFIVSDVSDGTLGVGGGTPKKIQAQQMLPPKVYLPDGFEFNGNVYINGALTVENATNLASGEVAVEDSLIELAYVQTVAVGCTGITAPNNLGFPAVGLTLYYYDTTSGGTATPSSIARIQGITFAGDQTEIRLHKFTKGGVGDIRPDGKLSVTGPYGPGSRWDFTVVSGPTTTTAFLTDDLLDFSGIRIKGASGDKELVWVYKEGPNQDIYNSFISTSNLGVSGSSNSIIASKFRSYGYSDSSVNNTFQFMGFDDGKPKIIIGGSTGQQQYGHHGYWAIQHDNRGITGATHQPLNFIFKKSTTDSESVLFKIASGASGQTFGSAFVTGQGTNTTTTFAQGFNSDFLDGAHGTTWATPFSIPISMSNGKIARDWLPEGTEAITKCFTQASSGLVIGDVVRVNPDNGSLTFARADTFERAEALGIVSSVTGNEVCVVTKGFISLTGNSSSNIWDVFPLVTGNVYYLSSNDYGSLIKDPDGPLPITLGQIRKPMLLALSAYTGYVANYLGIVSGEETDIVDSAGVIPIGMVMPYSGAISDIPYGWKLCDGTRLLKAEWAELYAIIGQNYYLEGRIPNDYTTGPVTIVLTNTDSYDIQVGDCLQVEVNVNGIYYNANTIVASVGAGVNYGRITVNSFSIVVSNVAQTLAGRTLRLRGRIPGQGQTGNPIFFLPDFRSRTLIGSTKDSGASFAGVDVSLGDIGGAGLKFISADQLPAHSHEIRTASGVSVGSGAIVGIGNATNSETSNLSTVRYTDLGPQLASGVNRRAFDVMQPYATINWIIRAKRGLSALILSGHNHDDRYHPLQGNFKVSPYSAGFYGDWGVYHDIPSSYPQMRRPGGFTGMFISRWDIGLIGSESNSVLQNFMYGDLSVFSDGITLNNLTGGGYAGVAFKLDSKISQVSIHGSTVNNLQPPKLKFTNIQAPNVDTFPIGQIIGLTAPKDGQDSYATNKFYTDTASKFIYNALPAGEFSASRNRPTGQFNVIAATGVIAPTEKTILSVVADSTPSGVGAKTEVHIRGDMSIYGNGLTGSDGNVILPAHNRGTFTFDTLLSRFRVIGGGTANTDISAINLLEPPTISLLNRNPRQGDFVSGDPIGIIEGLTAPDRDDKATNKWYVDQEIAKKRLIIPLAGYSVTGVAMFNSEDFEVSSSGRVSISRAITDIGVAITGSILPEPPLYPTGRIPAVNGVRGFNISTNQDLLGQGRPTRTILSAFANADPRSINSYDSAHEIFVNGDFTVFGDAYGRSSNRSAHGSASFAVDPVLNKVTILGGYTAGYVNGSYTVTNERATPAPTLEFVDNRGGCRGRITGLTAPSSGCDAANKDYVDQRISNIYMFGSPPAEMTTQFYAGTDADVIKTITLNPGTYNIKMEGHVQYFPQQGGGSARSCVVKHLQWVAAEGGLLSGQGELKLRFMNENLGGAGYGYLPGSSSVDMTEIQVLPRLANDPLQGQGYPVVFTLYALRGEASNGVPAGIAGGTGNRRFRSNGCSVTISRIS